MRPAARKMRRNLKRRLQPTIERIIARYLRPVSLFELEFGAEQLGGADGHDRRTEGWTIGQDGHVTLYVIDSDRRADEGQRLRAGVDEGAPVNVIQNGGVGNHFS